MELQTAEVARILESVQLPMSSKREQKFIIPNPIISRGAGRTILIDSLRQVDSTILLAATMPPCSP